MMFPVKGLRMAEDATLRALLLSSTNHGCVGVAKVVYYLYKDRFMCGKLGRTPQWYEKRDNEWVSIEDGYKVRLTLYEDVPKHYHDLACEPSLLGTYFEDLMKMKEKLQSPKFQSDVMRVCADLFYNEGFIGES